ncbi:DUF5050 domain-containing protein [bacterium]|nr:DUF5050 domain-containing protein [bacterium]
MIKNIIIAFVMFFLPFTGFAFANGEPIKLVDNGRSIELYNEENISMESEVVNILINPEKIFVNAVFNLKNLSDKEIEVTIGFPGQESKELEEIIPLKEFNTLINGQEIEVEERKEQNYYIYTWKVKFSPYEKKVITNSYRTQPFFDFGIEYEWVNKHGCVMKGVHTCPTYKYTMTTGKSWKDKIKEAKIIVTFDGVNLYKEIVKITKGYEIDNDRLIWSFTDFEPETNIEVSWDPFLRQNKITRALNEEIFGFKERFTGLIQITDYSEEGEFLPRQYESGNSFRYDYNSVGFDFYTKSKGKKYSCFLDIPIYLSMLIEKSPLKSFKDGVNKDLKGKNIIEEEQITGYNEVVGVGGGWRIFSKKINNNWDIFYKARGCGYSKDGQQDPSNPLIQQRLTESDDDDLGAVVCGNKIVYYSENKKGSNIWIMNIDGSDKKRLTFNLERCKHPSLVKSLIAFEGEKNGNTDIWIMDVNGENLKRLTKNTHYDGCPTISPCGKKIIYVSEAEDNKDIWIMNIDGSNKIRITKDPADDYYPSWISDYFEINANIFFTSSRKNNISHIYVLPLRSEWLP